MHLIGYTTNHEAIVVYVLNLLKYNNPLHPANRHALNGRAWILVTAGLM